MPKTLTVAHDAGGAEPLAAWCKAHPEEGPFIHAASGPAVRIFEKRGLVTVEPELGSLEGVQRVIVTPGWNSLHDFAFIKAAREKKIQSIAYLDHWLNYRLRFGYPREGWEENLPDGIWVGDEAALAMARQEIPGLPVTLVPNEYMREIRETYATVQASTPEQSNLVLFLSEPMSEPTTVFGDQQGVSFDEYGVLQDLIEALQGSSYRLLVRLHPSEPRDKYEKFGVEISSESDLLVDIARAKILVGMATMALAHAAACGKSVWSIWPDLGKSSPPLPVPGIHTVKQAKEIALP